MAEPHQHSEIKIVAESLQLRRAPSILDGPVDVPIRIRLQAVKMNNPPAACPARVMPQIICQEVIVIVRDHGDNISSPHRQCIHDDLVGVDVETIGDGALEIFQVVTYFPTDNLKSTSLNGKHTRVDPA